MHKGFNLGVGADIFVDHGAASEVVDFTNKEFDIDAWRTGECRQTREGNKLRIESMYGNFNFR